MGWKTVLAGEPSVDPANTSFVWNGSGWAQVTLGSDEALGNSGSGAAGIPFTTVIDNGVTVGTGLTSSAGGNIGVDFGTSAGQIADGAVVQLADGTRAFSGVVAGVDPTIPSHLATKNYVDSLVNGMAWKEPVVAATTANISNLSNPGTDTFDTIVLSTGDRLLVKDQTNAEENGIYVFDTSSTALVRATDMDAWDEVPSAAVFVMEGSASGDISFVCTADEGGTLETTSISWAQMTGGTGVTGGAGLSLSGSVMNVGQNTTGAITVNADDIAVNPDGTTIEVNGTSPGALRVVPNGIDTAQLAAGAVTNTEINAAAAIAFSKMEDLTTGRALISDGGGDVSVSPVTSAELAYLDGVTSPIQTQLDAKIPSSEKNSANGVATLDSNSIVVEDIAMVQTGTIAARPAAATANYGMLYVDTDNDELHIQLNP